MALIKQFENLPEQPPQVWKDVCEQTALLHRRGISDEEIDALCDYTWAIFRKENESEQNNNGSETVRLKEKENG